MDILETLEDKSIDVLLTDPPYGIGYTSNWSEDLTRASKKGILNDDPVSALGLLGKLCDILDRKMKENSHAYFFTRWDMYPGFKSVLDDHFKINNVLIWDTRQHGMGDLVYSWGNQTDFIIFGLKGKKPLVKRRSNLITVQKVTCQDPIHSMEKPVELMEIILRCSASKGDLVCDPFMGSGSTVKACLKVGGLDCVGIELDPVIFLKAKDSISRFEKNVQKKVI